MTGKIKPLGICDLCGAKMPENYWYTTHGAPRRYCSIECRNTGNSHEGEPIRYQKLIERIQRGEWRNPSELHPATPEEQGRRARLGRLREVERGTWRNPALSPEAKEKLSRPRKHTGALADALEKLGRGVKMAELTPEERIAFHEYRQCLKKEKEQNIE